MGTQEIMKKYDLPRSVKVDLEVTEEGCFFANLPEYPGCFTEARNFSDLIKNVTDAILTYFDVSREDAQEFNVAYLPPNLFSQRQTSLTKVISAQEKREYANKAVLFNYFASYNNGGYSSIR